MNSRIGNHIEFPNYEVDELVQIGKVMCRELEYNFSADAEESFKAYLAKRMTMPFFANARTVLICGIQTSPHTFQLYVQHMRACFSLNSFTNPR